MANGKNKALINKGPDEKQKKTFDSFGWWVAWLAFGAVILSALVKLIRSTDTPKKDDYYQ